MIAKITHGRSAARALAYDHGPGRADEHHHPRRVAGNVAGRDWQLRAHRMQRFVAAHQRDKSDRGVYRVALANPDTDRVLSDREWRSIAEKFVARFGADKGMWEATRHDRHHIHLTISKDRFDGSRMSTSQDYRRAAAICRELERDHGLTNAAERNGRGTGRVRGDAEAASRGLPQPDRDWLRSTIGRVLREGGGVEELRTAGVSVKLNQASTGRISGISYARTPDRHQSRDSGSPAEPLWFKGSTLGKAYSWNQVSDQLRGTAPQHGAPPAPPAVGTSSAAAQRVGGGERTEEPPLLERSLELKSLSVEQRRVRALEMARERAAERARTQERHRRQDRSRER
ncbi:relaxase/mobilization nuclease domain-containing protein [Mycobacterium marseillense]|uniref:MobA/VirD2-like nuclease domain-containing protein n=1 Tax=Mycobacterium marseillense TaxID=701042 RepID=A0AAC9YQS0_9MYCO|nr:hypothetical protein [Mycobacterium marseillense]ASW93254.1 hypothetical protein CKJ54_24700 [Mycobacterium marseillense]